MALGTALAAASLDSQLVFVWESSSPAQVVAISDCSTAQVGALGKTQMGADLGLHHLGNPSASTPSGQLQTTSEQHHHLAPGTADPPQRAEVGGQWSQSILATDLGKSLPLTCQ